MSWMLRTRILLGSPTNMLCDLAQVTSSPQKGISSSIKMGGDGLCSQESFHLEQSHLHPCSLGTRLGGHKAANLRPQSSPLCSITNGTVLALKML